MQYLTPDDVRMAINNLAEWRGMPDYEDLLCAELNDILEARNHADD